MSMSQQNAQSGRPLWMPHPFLLALIAALWAAAAAAQSISWPNP